MTKIMRIGEFINEGNFESKGVNENISRDYSHSLLEKLFYNNDLSVRIEDCGGKVNYKRGDMIEYCRDFFLEVKSIQETCNGYNEVKLGDSNMTYKVNIYDENGDWYAFFDFQLVYFNTDLAETVQEALDKAE